MTNEWDQQADQPRPKLRWWLLLALALAFGLGLAAAAALLRRSETVRHLLDFDPVIARHAAPLRTPVLRVAPPSAAPVPPDLTRRLDRLEQGVIQLAERTTESSSNAARAEGLLIAFAARRALDRGTSLGYIEGLLREQFGGNQPQAVAIVLSASRQPVTLEELQTDLDDIAPRLVARSSGESWWQGFKQELSALVVVRRASVPSTVPADRLTRAQRQLEMGHVDLALAEIARLPVREAASEWIVKARRYASARRALDIIETAALLAPHAAPLPTPAVVQPGPDRPSLAP